MSEQPVNTGKIHGAKYREDDYTFENQDEAFQPTEEDHKTWSALWDLVMTPFLREHVSQGYLKGHEILDLDPERIPRADYLNSKITPCTGWRILRTKIRYSKPLPWYEQFVDNIFLITDYIRSFDELKFTPEPDLLHDVLGHLPWMTLQTYADVEEMLAPPYLAGNEQERQTISRTAWYGPPEFGLRVEDGTIKIVGAGIISSESETRSTVEETKRLEEEGVIDFSGDIQEQLYERYDERKDEVHALIDEIHRLHEQGEMSSPEEGWNSMQKVYERTQIDREGLLGGDEVAFLPFDIDLISEVPKTVYAKNPFLFVFRDFESVMEKIQSFARPILQRRIREQNMHLPDLLSRLDNGFPLDGTNPETFRAPFQEEAEGYDNLKQQVFRQYRRLKKLVRNSPALSDAIREDPTLSIFEDYLPENFETDA